MRSTFNEEYKELNVNKKFKSVELDVVEEDLQELGPSGKLINKKKITKVYQMTALITIKT